MTTVKASIDLAAQALSQVSETPRLEAEILLEYVLNKTKTFIFTYPDVELTDSQLLTFERLVNSRSQGEPIAYLIGEQPFWTLNLTINHHTLIPRQDTETAVEAALNIIRELSAPTIFDLGTGSGAIACALAYEREDATIYASDICSQALEVAQENAKRHNLTNIHFIQSNWLENMPKKAIVDLIISNPPYIAKDCQLIDAHVALYEPHQALFSDENGYNDLLTIIHQSKYYLRPHGVLLMEHGIHQQETLKHNLLENGYRDIKNYKDLQQIYRCISGSLSK